MTEPAFPAATSSDPHTPEGWHHDPFGRHQHRWYSAGAPTALVRDAAQAGWVEEHDEPVGPADAEPSPVVAPDVPDGRDLARADAAASTIVSAPDLARSDDGGQRGGEDPIDVASTHVPAD